MPAYSLAIFDFDGTLADSAAWMRRALNEAAARFRFKSVGDAELEMLRGRSTRQIMAHLGIPLWKVPQLAVFMRRRMAEDIAQIRLFADVPELLRELSDRGLRIAIVSSNSEENVRRVLGADHAARIADFECGASLFGKARQLKAVIRRSGHPAQQTIYIGDERRDIEAAGAAGADSGAVLWGYATAEALAQASPTLTFATMRDITRVAA